MDHPQWAKFRREGAKKGDGGMMTKTKRECKRRATVMGGRRSRTTRAMSQKEACGDHGNSAQNNQCIERRNCRGGKLGGEPVSTPCGGWPTAPAHLKKLIPFAFGNFRVGRISSPLRRVKADGCHFDLDGGKGRIAHDGGGTYSFSVTF